VLSQAMRETDLAARIGGEEFAVLLSGTSLVEARVPLERIREETERLLIPFAGGTLRVTVSVGAAAPPPESTSSDDWLARADEAMYEAKHRGRNRVVVAGVKAGAELAGEGAVRAVQAAA
jgi:diguanylate cyclase (GGDEF)-like protein